MRLGRTAFTLAAAAGLTIGGTLGVLAPSFAEADPAPRPPSPDVVTSVDVVGSDHMTVTLRLHQGGPVRHLDPATVTVTAGAFVLHPRDTSPLTARPGSRVTFTFDAPPSAPTALVVGRAGFAL